MLSLGVIATYAMQKRKNLLLYIKLVRIEVQKRNLS